ncbi:protoporphyrinogen oxidase [Limnoglobus roseus]|uniref:Coproporphyrinogen III oxidase n=1 Tax=Limnoglobus roseus TaxID=2598579 RepID=A0A5C1AQG0_9BACT|nr:protoporphyrinogen oxidase [Limnoglobus roseus]QEL20266.1 protoporphyrinogen oxidase [Limnoglobus roseus]
MSRVVVIGGGLSGLAAAYRIRQKLPQVELTVLESANRPGGNVWTEHDRGFTVELGPNGFLDSKPATMDLCQSLGLRDQLLPASEGSRKNRFLYVNDRLHKLPGSPLGILRTPLLSFGGKLKLFTEPLRARPHRLPADETIAAFGRRRFGREAAETFLDALVTGIHGGDPDKLSVAAAFPRLPKFEREYGSVIRGFLRVAKEKRRAAEAAGLPRPGPARMWSFREGLRTLIESLAAAVPVTTGVAIKRIEKSAADWTVHSEGQDRWPADAVVVTCPAHKQAELLADLDAPLAAEIAGIGYTPIAVVVVGYRRDQVPHDLDGFGYIAPQRTRRDALGVQWCSSIFPDRAPPGCVTWRALCGGVNRPDVMGWDDATLLRKVQDELRVTMKVRGEMVFHRIVRWPKAIPQYAVGHLDRVARIEAGAARHGGLILGGNAYHGIAMNDCTEQAERITERVERALRVSG